MKFVVAKDDLTHLIGKLQNIVPQKTTTPILSNFLLEAKNHQLKLTATDLTVGVSCYTDAKVLEEGATTLPVRNFYKLVRELTAANVEVTCTAQEVSEVCAGSSRFKLHGLNRSEFPDLPDMSGTTQFKMKQKTLQDLLYRTAFTVSREDNRYVLTGVLAELENGQASFVGTDGRRLAKSCAKVELDSSITGRFIIPLKAVEEILKCLTDDEEQEVTLSLTNDKFQVELDEIRVVTKLLTGEYPDYQKVIPQSPEISVTLHREELATLLRQIVLFTSEKNHSVRFSFGDGELRLTANERSLGEGDVSMPVNYSGPRLDIAFNPSFFLDILRHCTGETVELEITDPYNPGKVRDSACSTAIYVIMPLRLNEE